MFQNPMQLLSLLQNNTNPMGLMNQMFGSNPIYQQVMQMTQGKNPNQIQQIIKNVAHERGMNDQQLNQFISQFGLKF